MPMQRLIRPSREAGLDPAGPLVLVTGGAGFIGSHTVDRLLAEGCRVRVLDRLDPQVHGERGEAGEPPGWLDARARFIHGDVADRDRLKAALEGVSHVVHLAAAVGVGQSMYEIEHYTRQNELATSVLLEELSNRTGQVSRLVVASSMSVYGEGRYVDPDGRVHDTIRRDPARVRSHDWEPIDASGRPLEAVATDESKCVDVQSVYALGKYAQERMALLVGAAYGIETLALRFFNVYGPRQSLSNPYTGVMAIFSSRILNGKPPVVYEDGRQRRDFVSVHDVAQAVTRATLNPDVGGSNGGEGPVLNIGSGQSVTVGELGDRLARLLGRPDLAPQVSGRSRVGDIRHCFGDISRARAVLGYEPQVSLEQGVAELAQWLGAEASSSASDRLDAAGQELAERGLTV
jgi:dTDP-L-rhamnose 4-epimerase